MSTTVDDLLEEVRKLSSAERARLVGSILATLDEPDPSVDAAWREEVERRVNGIESGDRSATPWTEARKKLGL